MIDPTKILFRQTAALIASVLLVATPHLMASETDNRIEASFRKLYVYKVQLKNESIKVESTEGVVTLIGQVSEPSQKALAQEAIARLPGVVRVDNKLIVKLEGNEDSDAWIRCKVRSVLTMQPNVNGRNTEVDIKDGVITLRGVAASEVQKDLTTEYAQDIKGVLRVTNLMTVVVPPTKAAEEAAEIIDDESISAQVRVILQSHRSTSSITTEVGTSDGIVLICGVANNQNERTLVSKLAADVNGVRRVVNNMSIASDPSTNAAAPVKS